MAWGGFILTNAGRNLLAKVQAGTLAELNITRFGMGDGSYSGSYSTISNLVSQKQSIPLRSKKAKDNFVNIEGYFSNEGLAEGFYFREWGIFAMNGANEILYAYDNAGADAEYIAPDGSIRYEKLLKAALAITADVNVIIDTSGAVYVTSEELDERLSNISSDAVDINIEDTAEHFASNNVEGALAELFQSVSDGKSLVAGAITDKGVPTSPTAAFATMADNIEAIETDPSIGTTDATAADILAPKKAVSQGVLRVGTMPDRGTVNQNLTTEGQEYTIPAGCHSGLGKIKAVITGLVASVIKAGTTVGGILGTFTSDGNVTEAQMLSGRIGYANGVKITGTIPSKGAATITPGTTNQTIAAGQYLSGIQTILGDPDLIAGNIAKNKNIFNVIGSYTGIKRILTGYLENNSSGVGGTVNLEPACVPKNCLLFSPYPTNGNNGRTNPLSLTSTQISVSGNYAVTMYIFIEFEEGIIKSKQELSIQNNSFTTMTVNTVEKEKSIVVAMGQTTYDGSSQWSIFYLTENNVLRYRNGLASYPLKICIVEFY